MCLKFQNTQVSKHLIETNINVNFNSFVVLSYAQGVSEKISHILKQEKVKVGYKPQQTINSLFPHPKERDDSDLQKSGIVHKINCIRCNFVYYGQTERTLKTRIAEHIKAVGSFDPNSKVGSHVHQFNHNMTFANVKVVGTVQQNSVSGLIKRNM